MTTLVLFLLIQLDIYPQNVAWDRYSMMAPLGRINSIASSNQHVFALSDDYLLFIDKHTFRMENTIYLNRSPELIGYDPYTTDLWIACRDNMIRLMTTSYSLRQFPIQFTVNRFSIDVDKIYIESNRNAQKYALDKITGAVSAVTSFPRNLTWYKKVSDSDIRQYPFLSPYYFSDDIQISQIPFERYPITAIHDDGMNLYVGTDRYGLLKYNKISWQSQRIVNGPLDSRVIGVRKTDDRIVLISNSGISYFTPQTGNWDYQRFRDAVVDLVYYNEQIFVARRNSVLRIAGTMEFPVGMFNKDILSLAHDERNLYIGTRSGAYRIIEGTGEPVLFGPTTHAVNVIYATGRSVYVGGELGMYEYDREAGEWSTVLSFGTKDIVEVAGDIYSLGTNNQIIRHPSATVDSATADTAWVLLPYFNVYDIDTDGTVLYCATYSGIYYYEPVSTHYRIIYNLPRITYENVFVVDDRLLALSKGLIYSLPLEYRD
ncbi:MAG: hypothetical protein JSU64_01980 [candidate division WOR-3 bacterium]|nr:MAG: hypothetical protein JSU64_01980 [candidate division WOR-3 bacterium]